MTADSCKHEFVWWNSLPKQQQVAQKCEWLSINMFDLFCFNHMTVLSTMRESVWWWQFPKRQQKHNNVNRQQLTFFSFVSIYDCLVKHALVCLMMTVFSTTQTNCIILVQSKVSIVDFWFVFQSSTHISDSLTLKARMIFCCFNLWLSTQACVSLFDDDSFLNNSNMLCNRFAINIINHWFPICFVNPCAINYFQHCESSTIQRFLQSSQECVASIYACCIVVHAYVSNIIRLFNNCNQLLWNYTGMSMMLPSTMLT